MTPAFTLDPLPDWLACGAGPRVIAALGGPAEALYVGGSVRAAVMGLDDPGDIDIATRLEPAQAAQALEKAGIKTVPTGLEHGTITAVAGVQNVEVTTLRRDVTTDGRRATVAFTRDWGRDARRRDFTMNTLLADPAGRVFDPLGRGVADARAGRVAFVGEAARRIAEDRLRALRFFRMHAYYGRGAPDAGALTACRGAAGDMGALSRERVTAEVTKILCHADPAPTLDLMWGCGLCADLRPDGYKSPDMAQLCALQTAHGAVSLAARLALLDRDGLRLTKKTGREATLLAELLAGKPLETEQNMREATYRHGRGAAAQALLIQVAQGRVSQKLVPQGLAIARDWPIPTCPVTAQALMDQGLKPGPALGKALRAAEEAWIARGFKS